MKKLLSNLGENLLDIVIVLGIVFVSIGAFLTSIKAGFYVTGFMLIMFGIALFIFGGDKV